MTDGDRVVARWRKPVVPLAVTEQPTVITVDLGRETQEISTRFKPEDIERFRLGYCCLQCWEPHETPFPEQCSLCRYPIRERQATDFRARFRGVERDAKAQRIEAGLDHVDDTHERRFHETKSGIIVAKVVS